jgi:flagellar biosynthetic protein FlhB
MSGQGGDKTEDPTPKRKREARKDGQIPKSAEIASWSAMLVATFLLELTAAVSAGRMTSLLEEAVLVIEQPEVGPALALLGGGLVSALVVVAPLGIGLMVLGVAVNLVQVGWAPSGKLLRPKMERVNPFKGIKRMLSPHSLWEGAKTLLKVVILGALTYRSINDIAPVLVAAGRQPLASTVALVGDRSVAMVRTVSLAGLGLALVDYGLQRRKVAKSLKMTKQDVRDEHRQSEGDPHLRGAIRSKQMSMSRNRMMAEVANADVVLVNPTHVAVALKYDPASGAPRVVAKGADHIAARIRSGAEDAGVPMVEDVQLARAIFRACDLGQEIPAELYDAVARVLAFIFALSRSGSAAGMHRVPVGLGGAVG